MPGRVVSLKHVIVGLGAAGCAAAQAIRSRDPSAEIAAVTGEGLPARSRMLATHYLSGHRPLDGTILRSRDWFEQLGVKVTEGRAVSIDRSACRVVLDDESCLRYDALLVATGSRPVLPPVPGLNPANVRTLWTFDQAGAVKEAVAGGAVKTAVVIGAGFLGVQAAVALADTGVQVVLAELLGRVIPTRLDDTASGMVSTRLAGIGVRVMLARRAIAVTGEGATRTVEFRTAAGEAEKIAADLVAVTAGTRANLEIAQEAGIATRSGILVDDYLRTSDHRIYAAGDVAEANDRLQAGRAVNALWPVAAETGKMAGLNMAGARRPYEGSVAFNFIDVSGLRTVSIGDTDPEGERAEDTIVWRAGKLTYRKLVLGPLVQGGSSLRVVQGAILTGDVSGASQWYQVVKRRLAIDPSCVNAAREPDWAYTNLTVSGWPGATDALSR